MTEPTDSSDNRKIESNSTSCNSQTFFDWIRIGEGSVYQYVNALASMDKNSSECIGLIDKKENEVVVDDPLEMKVSDNSNKFEEISDSASKSFDSNAWVNFSSHTSEVWKQIRQDFNDVVIEPRDALRRTALSIRDQISVVANAVRNADPNELILPEKVVDDNDFDKNKSSASNGPDIKSDISQLVNTFRNGLLSTGSFLGLISDDTEKPTKTKREIRLDILRADPATYELEPPPPHSSAPVKSFSDWCTAYFNKDTCEPLPGIPLVDTRLPEYAHLPSNELIQLEQPNPYELLSQYPFMRNYLTQLVHPDGQVEGNMLTDFDFWSRYYYRVWLLESTELRRRWLAKLVTAVPNDKTVDSANKSSCWSPVESGEGESSKSQMHNDWSDTDSVQETNSFTQTETVVSKPDTIDTDEPTNDYAQVDLKIDFEKMSKESSRKQTKKIRKNGNHINSRFQSLAKPTTVSDDNDKRNTSYSESTEKSLNENTTECNNLGTANNVLSDFEEVVSLNSSVVVINPAELSGPNVEVEKQIENNDWLSSSEGWSDSDHEVDQVQQAFGDVTETENVVNVSNDEKQSSDWGKWS